MRKTLKLPSILEGFALSMQMVQELVFCSKRFCFEEIAHSSLVIHKFVI